MRLNSLNAIMFGATLVTAVVTARIIKNNIKEVLVAKIGHINSKMEMEGCSKVGQEVRCKVLRAIKFDLIRMISCDSETATLEDRGESFLHLDTSNCRVFDPRYPRFVSVVGYPLPEGICEDLKRACNSD